MNKSVMRFGLASLAAIILATVPSNVAGQTTNKPLADKKTVSPSSETNAPDRLLKAGPFHGKLAAIDKVGKTITVGKRTFQITSETKIKKAGKPATLDGWHRVLCRAKTPWRPRQRSVLARSQRKPAKINRSQLRKRKRSKLRFEPQRRHQLLLFLVALV